MLKAMATDISIVLAIIVLAMLIDTFRRDRKVRRDIQRIKEDE